MNDNDIIITRPVPKMRTIKEAAAEAGVPVYALRRWVKSGEVPAVYAGKKALINLDHLIDFLNGSEQA
ncbi:helix-turn-helix domain-containing protein [Ruminococcus sp.]|uniref:helix-turn-helix domain-containing protein n=1 Tax=Ruminococcus sp. TaxID=41978 RepID=UPI0025EA1618|nr:helix-turn-helix domain-containing protein [Ruminococcus sp.]MBQ9541945.1 helix-turn-helix domain-containing protein [Ruminococcus sp.]